MQKIKCTKRDITALSGGIVESLGYSVITNKIGEICDAVTEKKPEMKLNLVYDDNAIRGCTDPDTINAHIDIFAESAKIVYDFEKEMSVESIVLRCFFNNSLNYSIAEFKLYGANDKAELFNDDNEIAHERGIDFWHEGDRNNADWLYDVEGKFRYFGIYIIKSNAIDDITRLGFVGVYNKDYTEQMSYLRKYSKSLLLGMEPKCITNGAVFCDEETYKVNGEHTFSFKLDRSLEINKLWVVTNGEAEIDTNGLFKNAPAVMQAKYGRYEYVFECENTESTNNISVTVKGNTKVDQIGAFSANRKVAVDFEKTICKDYMGIGANVVPMSFMPESIEAGYNDIYWEFERSRILKAKPNVVRFWFQPDWLVDNYEDYKAGRYDFGTQKMQSVYKYLDVFKECGTEVEFDFGWKVSTNIQEWFSFKECALLRNSAPRELDLFAKCCGGTLKELVKNRGYDNIKYLTFYNEPDYGLNTPDRGDFIVIGCDRKVYWERMLRLCREEIDKVGLKSIKMWGCEQSGSDDLQMDWINYFNKNCSDVLDTHTIHRYTIKSNSAPDYFASMVKAAGKKPVMLTECGQCYSNFEYNWDINNVQLFNDATNAGVSGALIWVLNSMELTDPCSFTMRNFIDMWDMVQVSGGIENVREVYYEWAMLSHYVPNHCKSVKTTVTDGFDEIRASAFKAGEDYTVVVEVKNSADCRQLEIDLGKAVNKKFYKHVYMRPCLRDGNAILPPCVGTLNVTDKIQDTVTGNYQEIVYTTIKSVEQIRVPQAELYMTPKETKLLSYEMIDCSGTAEFQLIGQLGASFSVDTANGVIVAAENAKQGDMCAIKISSKSNPKTSTVMIAKIR